MTGGDICLKEYFYLEKYKKIEKVCMLILIAQEKEDCFFFKC